MHKHINSTLFKIKKNIYRVAQWCLIFEKAQDRSGLDGYGHFETVLVSFKG